MKLYELIEILEKDKKVIPGEVAVNINTYYRDIFNAVPSLVKTVEVTVSAEKASFSLADMGIDPMIYQRGINCWLKDQVITVHPIKKACFNDYVFAFETNIIFGIYKENGMVVAAPAGTIFIHEYYAYPAVVTVDTVDLPVPDANQLILYRAKADMYAEAREWDRAGYYSKKYEQSLVFYRRQKFSSTYQHSFNTDTRI